MKTSFRAGLPALASLAGAVAALVAAPAQATENAQVRELLGAPSFELATPQPPGWYGQIWYQHYSADKLRDNNGNQVSETAPIPGLGTVPVAVGASIRADVVTPRITYLSEHVLADGHLGFSLTMPIVHQTNTITLTPSLPPGLPAPVVGAVNAGFAQESAAMSGSHTGLADPEIEGFVDWAQDESRVLVGFAFNPPVGDYDLGRPVNTGAGKYWTFKPLLVASRVWDNGMEVGLRATYSFNTTNHDTQVRSGQYLHVDWAAMYRANEQWRFGLQGYVLKQFTDDSGPGVAPDGNKGQVLAAGPVVAYLAESGTWAVDFKLMQEFSVRNRPQGQMGWVRFNWRMD